VTPTAFRGARIVVTGAAGCLGSHLTDALLAEGAEVTGIDDLLTGRLRNLAHLDTRSRCSLQRHDVAEDITADGSVGLVLHAASHASPIDDLIAAVLVVPRRGATGPINPGSDHEVRCPGTSLARRELGWTATTSLTDGLARTVAWYRRAH